MGAGDNKEKTLFGRSIVEPFGSGLIMLNRTHANVHAKRAFSAVTAQAVVAAAASIYQEIIVPVGVLLHLRGIHLYTDGSGKTYKLIEAPTITDGITSATLRSLNRLRDNDDPAGIEVWKDPSGISGGTSLDERYYGGSINSPVGGTDGLADEEWVFPAGTYLIQLINDAVGNAKMFIRTVFYYTELV